MKVKRIQTKSLKESLNEFKETYERLRQGKKVRKRMGEVYFENLAAVRNILTEERLKLLKTIRQEKPKSIYKLAKLVGRDFKNVNQDVHMLAELGIVQLVKGKKLRASLTPELVYDNIEVSIAI